MNHDTTKEDTTRPQAAESRDPVVSCPAVSLKRYWLAMNATAFDSAVHALALFCGVAGAHEATQCVPALNLQQLAWVFLIAFGRAILAYVQAHPVTDLVGVQALACSPSASALEPQS